MSSPLTDSSGTTGLTPSGSLTKGSAIQDILCGKVHGGDATQSRGEPTATKTFPIRLRSRPCVLLRRLVQPAGPRSDSEDRFSQSGFGSILRQVPLHRDGV